MDFQLLGPFEATLRGQSVVPTAGKPRRILALLALHPGKVLPVSTLMDELWGANPPASALTTLQTYILQLRRRLGTAMGPDASGTAKDVLTTRHGGYALQIESACTDVRKYEQLAASAQSAFEKNRDEQASATFSEALSLWQGPALVDVPVGPVLEIEVMRLEESRLVTTERRIDADLRLGKHSRLIAELFDLISRHPQHEGLHSQAMVALYRAGRQASALTVYRELRTRLIEELGVEPSPQLQRLHQAILTVDTRLDVLTAERRGSTFDLYAA
ncbi:BTAD domain-containing putative transcriptional regulator [Streptomyces fuscichromogenes]|uniref:AfsR/SARP family transcriptional regulator n=1 Tax=Streptomyces fuscichromogenes TaxID=1324013 RepID=UPI00382ABEEF